MIVEKFKCSYAEKLLWRMKGGVVLFEHLNDEDLIDSYEQSIRLNLNKDFIILLRIAIRERGLEKFVKIDKNTKQMINT